MIVVGMMVGMGMDQVPAPTAYGATDSAGGCQLVNSAKSGPGLMLAAADCWDVDSCTNDLGCKRVGTVWQLIMPANMLLYKSGTPVVPVLCLRVYSTNNTCSPGTRADFNSQSCGVIKIVTDPNET